MKRASENSATFWTIAAMCALAVLPTWASPVRADARSRAYVVNTNAHLVSVIDTATNSVLRTIPVGTLPARVAVTADGTLAYVTNNGSNSISVIDTATDSVVATIAGVIRPTAVVVTPDGARLYVIVDGGAVAVIDTGSKTPIATISIGASPLGGGSAVAVSPNGRLVYAVSQGYLAVIDTATNAVVASPYVGPSPAGVAFSPDGTRAYVANAWHFETFAGSIGVVDTATSTVVGSIPYPAVLTAIAVTPDGTRAYAAVPSVFVSTGYGSAFIASRWVAVFDLSARTVVTSVLLSGPPSDVAVTPDGARAYVTVPGANAVTLIDTATNAVAGGIPVAAGPTGVVMAPEPVTSSTPSPEELTVALDIKPGVFPNRISPNSRTEIIPVAILSTDTFDARDVDAQTVRFGATGTEAAPIQIVVKDVNRDGRADLLLRFRTRDTRIPCGATSAVLTGQTSGGGSIEGSDSVKTAGCR